MYGFTSRICKNREVDRGDIMRGYVGDVVLLL